MMPSQAKQHSSTSSDYHHSTSHSSSLYQLLIFIIVTILMSFYADSGASKAIPRNRCELKLVADHEFFRVIGQSNYANAARYLVNMIERVNGIFGQVEWGLDIQGHRLVDIGFTIKEIKILEQPHENQNNHRQIPRHFNAPLRPGTESDDAMEMLDSFSFEEGTDAACLCLLVTAKSLSTGVLGLANVSRIALGYAHIGDHSGDIGRGICAKDPQNTTAHRNTAVMSVRRKQELMITRVVDLVAAHEIGHAFGSSHDDVYDPDCVPQNSRDGRFLMWDAANTGYDRNNYQFSPCSVRAVHRVLYSLAHACFVEERRPLCGNGLVEEGEQCDSGGQITGGGDKGASGASDCCTPACRLREHALCSPRHSECCSQQCAYTPANEARICQARSEDTCRAESRCSGQSDKCPEAAPLADGTPCTDEGTCFAGECVSYCRWKSAELSPCLCEDDANACRRCCRSKHTGQCAPVQPVRWLPEDSMCIHGQCRQNVCEKSSTDSTSFLRRLLDGPAQRKFLSDYIVFIVVIVTLLIWFPCGAFVMYKDRQKHQKLLEKRDAAQSQVQIVQSLKRVSSLRSRTTMNGVATEHKSRQRPIDNDNGDSRQRPMENGDNGNTRQLVIDSRQRPMDNDNSNSRQRAVENNENGNTRQRLKDNGDNSRQRPTTLPDPLPP